MSDVHLVDSGRATLGHIRRDLDELEQLINKARAGNTRALRYTAWRLQQVGKSIDSTLSMGRVVDELEAAVDAERAAT